MRRIYRRNQGKTVCYVVWRIRFRSPSTVFSRSPYLSLFRTSHEGTREPLSSSDDQRRENDGVCRSTVNRCKHRGGTRYVYMISIRILIKRCPPRKQHICGGQFLINGAERRLEIKFILSLNSFGIFPRTSSQPLRSAYILLFNYITLLDICTSKIL